MMKKKWKKVKWKLLTVISVIGLCVGLYSYGLTPMTFISMLRVVIRVL